MTIFKSKIEIKSVFSALGITFSDAEIDELFDAFDSDKSGLFSC